MDAFCSDLDHDGKELTLSGCTVSGNSARLGCAIYNNHGTVTVSGCTLSGDAAARGRGIN